MSRNEPLRLEVVSRQGFADGRARRLLPALRRDSPAVRDVRIADVYIVHGAPALRAEDARDVVSDSVAQEVRPEDRWMNQPRTGIAWWKSRRSRG